MFTLRELARFQRAADRDSPADPPRCPYCGEHVLIDFDKVLHHWYCAVCGRIWQTDDPRWTGRARA